MDMITYARLKKFATGGDTNSVQIQSDWNQNDKSALDFIKNKPFYGNDESKWAELVINPSLNAPSFGYCYSITPGAPLALDKEYKVVVDGKEYICSPRQVTYSDGYSGIAIGAENSGGLYFNPPMFTDTSIPFHIVNTLGDSLNAIFLEVPTNLQIYVKQADMKLLDRKYINYIPGERVSGKEVIYNGMKATCGNGAEVFNDLESNIAIGNYSHAEGLGTVAEGEGAHAEGGYTQARGLYSHTEGYKTIAATANSHVQGVYNATDGEQGNKFIYDEVSNTNSATFDLNQIIYIITKPSLNCQTGLFNADSFTEITAQDLQVNDIFVLNNADGFKEYYIVTSLENIDEKINIGQEVRGSSIIASLGNYAHVVGNGFNNENRSNAHTLDWEGNAWYQGDVYVGSTSGVNRDEGSKKLATEDYVNDTLNAQIDTKLKDKADVTHEYTSLILKSSTEGSNKRFRVTIDDSGELHTEEIVE